MDRRFIEKLHGSVPEWRLLRESKYSKPCFAFAEDVHLPIFNTFDLANSDRYTGAMNRVLAFFFGAATKKDQTKGFITIDTAVDHDLIAVFKNMERNDDARKQDEIGKRKEGDFHQII